jgi:iron complex transport system substrate-binding protein
VNAFEDQENWIQISEEDVISRDPDVITTTVYYVEDPIQEIKNRTSWGTMAAIKENQVYLLDENIMSRPGPRIGDAVELVAKTVYPEIFK